MKLDPRPFLRRKTPYDARLLASLAHRGVRARGSKLAKVPRDQYPAHTWCEFRWPLDRLDRAAASTLRMAAEDLDGRLLPPGAVLSFWGTVRRPAGMLRYRSNERPHGRIQVVESMDALSLVASVAYRLALLGGLEIIERHGHVHNPSGPFGAFERGRDAGIEYGFRDLRTRNNRGVPLVIAFEVTDYEIRGALLAGQPCPFDVTFEETVSAMAPPTLIIADPGLRPGDERVITAGAPGYHIETTRIIVFGNGQREWDYLPDTDYQPIDTVIGRGPTMREAQAVESAHK